MWCSVKAVCKDHFGRRAVALLLLGTVWTLYGFALLTGAPHDRFSGDGRLLHVFDHPVWGALWVLCGAITVAVGLRGRRGRDTPGFHALFVPAGSWTALHVIAVVTSVATGGAEGAPRGGAPMLIWATVVGLILLIAGWSDPKDDREVSP